MKKLFFITLISFLFLGCVSSSQLWGEKQGNFYVETDDVRQTTTIRHNTFCNIWSNNITDTVIIDNKFYLTTTITGGSWCFLNRMIFLNDDGERFEMKLGRGKHDVLNSGKIFECYTNCLGDSEVEQFKKVISGKNPCVAYLGDRQDIDKQKVKKDILKAYLETIDKYYELNK